jgi:hypothetical protein
MRPALPLASGRERRVGRQLLLQAREATRGEGGVEPMERRAGLDGMAVLDEHARGVEADPSPAGHREEGARHGGAGGGDGLRGLVPGARERDE